MNPNDPLAAVFKLKISVLIPIEISCTSVWWIIVSIGSWDIGFFESSCQGTFKKVILNWEKCLKKDDHRAVAESGKTWGGI